MNIIASVYKPAKVLEPVDITMTVGGSGQLCEMKGQILLGILQYILDDHTVHNHHNICEVIGRGSTPELAKKDFESQVDDIVWELTGDEND